MSDRYLRDNGDDRRMGELWESEFARLAAWYGKAFTLVQADRQKAARWSNGGRPALLPDVLIFSDPGEHHEVKHKNPTQRRVGVRSYGWEDYRLDALMQFQSRMPQQPVYYTIHDWEAAGVKASDAPMPNVLQDWRFVAVQHLHTVAVERLTAEPIKTWVNGKASWCLGYYWPITMWQPLDQLWGLPS